MQMKYSFQVAFLKKNINLDTEHHSILREKALLATQTLSALGVIRSVRPASSRFLRCMALVIEGKEQVERLSSVTDVSRESIEESVRPR